jgi:hypothetical protein
VDCPCFVHISHPSLALGNGKEKVYSLYNLCEIYVQVETTTGTPMSDEAANALHVGVGVAATCIGVMCSLYTCCCHVWRRLKGHTPVVAAGAAAVAGTMAAGQLASVLAGTAAGQVNSGGRTEVTPSNVPPDRCNEPGLSCQVHMVSLE